MTHWKCWVIVAILMALAGCNSSEPRERDADQSHEISGGTDFIFGNAGRGSNAPVDVTEGELTSAQAYIEKMQSLVSERATPQKSKRLFKLGSRGCKDFPKTVWRRP